MKIILLSLFLVVSASTSAFAEPEPNFHFSYQPNEGADSVSCTHERIRNLPDWKVLCTFFGEQKEFTAHVILRQLPAQTGSTFELLYWVTAAGDAPGGAPKFHSTSAILKMKGETAIASLSLAQGVENDYASLVLDASLADSKK
ncbi:MAG: hypothetical protein ACXVBE_16795 [Bdellovibrionota bacterium]